MFIDLDNHEDRPKFVADVHQDKLDSAAKIIVRLGRHVVLMLSVAELHDLATAITEALAKVPGLGETVACDMCGQQRSYVDMVLDLGTARVCVDCYRHQAN
jgi:hypothetical protein